MKTPQELVEEIISTGMRQQDIVVALGLSRAFVSQLRHTGHSMDYKRYAALSDFHKHVMRQQARKNRKPVGQAVEQ